MASNLGNGITNLLESSTNWLISKDAKNNIDELLFRSLEGF